MQQLIRYIDTVEGIEEVIFNSIASLSVDDFRMFLQARDKRWYKQKNPIEWPERQYGVLCHFGHIIDGRNATYSLICLSNKYPLENIYRENNLPMWLAMSPIFTLKRSI